MRSLDREFERPWQNMADDAKQRYEAGESWRWLCWNPGRSAANRLEWNIEKIQDLGRKKSWWHVTADGRQSNPGTLWYRLETVNMLHGVTPACENVTYVDLFDEIFCTRGKLQREVGHLRICVVVVMRQIHNKKKTCTARIHLTVQLSADMDVDVGRDVGLRACVCLV